METSDKNVFDSFGITSVVMPYYGHSHVSFLLLSTLCRTSRRKLDEYYEEFRKHMLRYSKELILCGEKLELMTLPNDLFRFDTI